VVDGATDEIDGRPKIERRTDSSYRIQIRL
jgi:hypothetical protein